jgi:cardiolipin synthase
VLTWILIALDWSLRLVMAVVILLRKKSSEAMPWLLVCFAFPIPGALLYVLIGGNRLGRRRSREHSRAMGVIDGLTRLAAWHGGVCAVPTAVPDQRHDLARMAERIGHLPIVGGNTAELIGEPTDFLNRIVRDIDGAQSYVHCLFYIFEDDRAGQEVGAALKRAAARGVSARLLVDAVGSRPLFKRLAPELRAAGVEVHDMLPVNPLRRRLARIDLRNHRKLVVIDGSTIYTGSQNVIDPAMGEPASRASGGGGSGGGGSAAGAGAAAAAGGAGASRGGGGSGGGGSRRIRRLFTRSRRQWDDLSVRLCGPIALQGDVVFLEDWYSTTGEVLHTFDNSERPVALPPCEGDVVAQLIPSGPTYESDVFHDFVVAALHDAQKSIELCTPYFVPTVPVMLALKVAAARGVSVDLVVPERSDNRLVSLAAPSHFQELLDAGVRIHLHRGLMLHSKSLAIDDDLAIIGSGNLDMRSFHLNFELNMVLYGGAVTDALHLQHKRYMANAHQINARAWPNRPLWRKLLEKAVALMGPLL